MKIVMTKRKAGIYSQWYVVDGLNEKGIETSFLIYHEHANTYAEAVRFWNKTWGDKCTAFVLRNSMPYSSNLLLAC